MEIRRLVKACRWQPPVEDSFLQSGREQIADGNRRRLKEGLCHRSAFVCVAMVCNRHRGLRIFFLIVRWGIAALLAVCAACSQIGDADPIMRLAKWA